VDYAIVALAASVFVWLERRRTFRSAHALWLDGGAGGDSAVESHLGGVSLWRRTDFS